MASPVKTIVINVCDSETRIALTEGGKLKTIIIEQQSHLGMVGNIYKGRVTRVIPGIQSAFIDIGLDRAGFLYFDDVIADPKSIKSPEIEKHLREGQEVIVQVNKDPLGTKGARVSMHLALAGRYLVFLPNRSDVNLSKKITEEQERKRLSELSNDICPKGHGMIIRTAAEGVVDKLIKNDLKALEKKWGVIEKSKAKTKTPGLIYREQEVSVKTIRDLYTQGVEKIIVDDKEVYQELKSFLKHSIPEAEKKLQHFKKQQLIFDYFEIENQLTRAIRRKVWLPSGGYLYVESTEALTTFDINTGRYIGEQAARQTILNTNLEAAVEVAAQLELRNIGGIIVIDFIDMDYPEDREKVLKTFTEKLEKDRAKTNVLNFSEFGLLQMTRKRTTDTWGRLITETCPTCAGSGRIPNQLTEINRLFRDLIRIHLQNKSKKFKVSTRKDIYELLTTEDMQALKNLEKKWKIKVTLKANSMDLETLKTPAFQISTG